MKFSDYMKDNQITLLVCFAGGLFFSVLLLAFGISLSEMALLWVCFAIIVFFTMFAYFRKQQKRIQYLLETMETLDKKYLIAEIADRPETELEKIYFRLLKTALKSMTDEVTEIRRLNVEYKDFIEQWIHEIKVPITGVQLCNPKLVMADEPTGSLDSNSARILLQMMSELNKETGATILMVTHDAFCASYADRILFLKDGKIFNEILKGEKTRDIFYHEILDVLSLLGGDNPC